MADNKFDTPQLREYPIIPKLKKVLRLIANLSSQRSSSEPLGFPESLSMTGKM